MKVNISSQNYMICFFLISVVPLNTQLNIPYVFHPASKSSPNPTL